MKDPAYQAVCNAFGRYFEVHPTRVLTHHHLQRDWGLDATELALIASEIEETSGVELDDPSEYADIETVGELVQLVRMRMHQSRRPLRPLRLVPVRAE